LDAAIRANPFEGDSAMNRPFDFRHSPQDAATFRRWRRGMALFYGSVGLLVAAVLIAAHFAVALHVASR
jgi:hypothetical protein